MIISMDKKYTLAGEPFTLLTVTMPDLFPVVGYTPDCAICRFPIDGTSAFFNRNLVEVTSYHNFVIDEPVLVRDDDSEEWQRRHFAGVDADGAALVWCRGSTKWATSLPATVWNQCRRPTAEELAE